MALHYWRTATKVLEADQILSAPEYVDFQILASIITLDLKVMTL
jgi:hypothetical protein